MSIGFPSFFGGSQFGFNPFLQQQSFGFNPFLQQQALQQQLLQQRLLQQQAFGGFNSQLGGLGSIFGNPFGLTGQTGSIIPIQGYAGSFVNQFGPALNPNAVLLSFLNGPAAGPNLNALFGSINAVGTYISDGSQFFGIPIFDGAGSALGIPGFGGLNQLGFG